MHVATPGCGILDAATADVASDASVSDERLEVSTDSSIDSDVVDAATDADSESDGSTIITTKRKTRSSPTRAADSATAPAD